jgi:hypothetical protein
MFILSLWCVSCCVILYVYLSNIPAIATEIFVVISFCPFTTCFGPCGPSSGEIQEHNLYILRVLSKPQRIRCSTIDVHNFNHTPTALWVQSWRDIISGGTRTRKVEYHWVTLRSFTLSPIWFMTDLFHVVGLNWEDKQLYLNFYLSSQFVEQKKQEKIF